MRLSDEDRADLVARLASYGMATPHAIAPDLQPTVERIVARHVAAALAEARGSFEEYVKAARVAGRTYRDYQRGDASAGAVAQANRLEDLAAERHRAALTIPDTT